MTAFSLISKKKPLVYIILLILWNSGIFIAIISFFFWGKEIFWTFLQIYFVIFCIWIIGNFFFKRYKINGEIVIKSDFIQISTNHQTIFEINKIKNLTILYHGCEGDSAGAYTGFLRIKDGSRNFITFDYEGSKYKFEFLITKKYFLNSIYWILKKWKDNNIDFKVFDQYKKDITNKTLIQTHNLNL